MAGQSLVGIRFLAFLAVLVLLSVDQPCHGLTDTHASGPHRSSCGVFLIFTQTDAKPPQFHSAVSWYSSLLDSLPVESPGFIKPELIYVYSFSGGFAACLTPKQAELIAKAPGVVEVFKDKVVKIHDEINLLPRARALNGF